MKDVVVGVPAVLIGVIGRPVLATDPVIEKDGHPRHPGFHQSAAQKARLSRTVHAIAFAEPFGLLIQVESPAIPRRGEQLKCFARRRIPTGVWFHALTRRIERVQKPFAFIESC